MKFIYLLLLFTLASCYPKIEIEDFDEKLWLTAFESCQSSKIEMGKLIVKNENKILGKGQAEVKALLGQPNEHELYRRNQKFFHYALTPSDSCQEIRSQRNLSILFDALDRAKEVMISE